MTELKAKVMLYKNDKPSGFKETEAGIVEVKIWEAFLLYNRHNLYTTLSAYSLDNGPLEKDGNDLATVSFRFMARDWRNTLKDLLDQHNIPVIKEKVISTDKASVWHTV